MLGFNSLAGGDLTSGSVEPPSVLSRGHEVRHGVWGRLKWEERGGWLQPSWEAVVQEGWGEASPTRM